MTLVVMSSACSLLPASLGGGKKTSNPSSSSSSSTAGAPESGTIGSTAATAKGPASDDGFTEADEGSMGPMQDKYEGQIVFSHAKIEKKETNDSALVRTTTLNEPLYVRAYFPKTPLRVLRENEQNCPWSNRRQLRFMASLEGAPTSRGSLYVMPMAEQTFPSLRSKTITGIEGPDIESIVPTAKFEMNGGDNGALSPFATLAAQMKPGKNVVVVEMEVGCEAKAGKNGKDFTVVSRGQIELTVKPGDLAAFARRVGPTVRPSFDPASEKRLKAIFAKKLAKGARILAFAADGTEVEPMSKKSTVIRFITANADKTCSYMTGKWIEPYLGGGKFDTGSLESVDDPTLLPCP
jgi:hypothetical protein